VSYSTTPLCGDNALVEAFSRDESERKRIVERIHDDILQDLGTGLIRADICKRLLQMGKYADLDLSLTSLRKSIDSSIESLRDLMVQLRPYDPDQRGLTGALEDYTKHFERTNYVPVTLTTAIPRSLGFLVEIVLYRLIQEALSAAVHQLGIDSIRLDLRAEGDSVVLRLSEGDDGEVIPSLVDDELTPWPGTRQSLQQLVGLVGGQVDVRVDEDEVSRIIFTMPLSQPE
jgi:signal transduction histidine kinase